MLITDNVWQLYVGANNLTGVVELHSMRAVLERNVDAWTETASRGHYGNEAENSVIVTVSESEGTARRVAKELRVALNQDSVGLVKVSENEMEFV